MERPISHHGKLGKSSTQRCFGYREMDSFPGGLMDTPTSHLRFPQTLQPPSVSSNLGPIQDPDHSTCCDTFDEGFEAWQIEEMSESTLGANPIFLWGNKTGWFSQRFQWKSLLLKQQIFSCRRYKRVQQSTSIYSTFLYLTITQFKIGYQELIWRDKSQKTSLPSENSRDGNWRLGQFPWGSVDCFISPKNYSLS